MRTNMQDTHTHTHTHTHTDVPAKPIMHPLSSLPVVHLGNTPCCVVISPQDRKTPTNVGSSVSSSQGFCVRKVSHKEKSL